jgi:oligopeptidase A
LRAAYNEALPKVTEFWTNLGADERLYAKYKAIDPASLNKEQRAAWDHAMRGFVLSGAELQGAAKERFAQIQARSAELAQKFSENALDATDAFAYYARIDELDGVPADVIAAAKAAAEADGKEGYKLTLKMPSYLPVMQFAKSSALREKIYQAYVTRASEQAEGDGKRFDNTAVMKEILALRLEESQLLGYRNFGEVSLVPKMADSPQQVIDFLRDLAQRARPMPKRMWPICVPLPRLSSALPTRSPGTGPSSAKSSRKPAIPSASRSSSSTFRPPRCWPACSRLSKPCSKSPSAAMKPGLEPLRGVLPHRALHRTRPSAGRPVLSGPSGAQGQARRRLDGRCAHALAAPRHPSAANTVAHLVCNFASGVDGKPALLTHDDVITLFHETGHGLHHMLTQVNERDVSGIAGVEWDAVELPSQFMENFCWEWDVLKHMTAHVDTGEALPRALYDKMIAAKNFQSGMQTLRQIEFALFDMLLHTEHNPADDFMALLNQVRAEVSVLQSPAYNRMAHTFSHIFAGGYAAGYYSYKWAEVLSADAYAAFEETMLADGSPNPETGRKYRESILEAGGSRPAMESFKAFRGREPQIDALLRHQGMSQAA